MPPELKRKKKKDNQSSECEYHLHWNWFNHAGFLPCKVCRSCRHEEDMMERKRLYLAHMESSKKT